jgi:hypothetical protein
MMDPDPGGPKHADPADTDPEHHSRPRSESTEIKLKKVPALAVSFRYTRKNTYTQ